MQAASQVGFLAYFYKAIGDTVEMLFCDTIEKTLKVTLKKKKRGGGDAGFCCPLRRVAYASIQIYTSRINGKSYRALY